ncbi:FkbM family methyltransferase [Hymenobacter setariae]|uniref:FkbM family methyltransferase n=1 Tax=Hymenobacter setariae TaxID=2594794 RepID=A0A558BUN5_9BACT|nr:FkbM family methyltransferase [Hymenobacter setariae]TVT40212.1 FkbM family methyltransferase [Hymenobacter setariae]
MNPLKALVKSALASRAQRQVIPFKDLIYLGSVNHGYHVPASYLTSASVCYCVGAGTDISLDTELASKFNSQVFVFDPMPYALAHFTDLVKSVEAGKKFYADRDKTGYAYTISSEALTDVKYCGTGVWNEKKKVKFYVPARDNYAGHSITNLQKTEEYIEAPVDTLVNIMRELGHSQLDLLKLEIEGSEYTVIEDVLVNKVDVKIILVEFDEFHHRGGFARFLAIRNIEKSSQKLLKEGYKLVHSLNFYKRTFIREDILNELVGRC